MKRIAMLLAVLMIMSVLPIMSVAAPTYIVENPPITMPKSSPVVDGVIEDGDGWSAKGDFNYDTTGHYWSHQQLSTTADLYFAYDEDGIYFAGDIVERDYIEAIDQNGNMAEYIGNGFIYSTGEDDINFDEEDGYSEYGWNGDIFTLMIDPLDMLSDAGYSANTDCTPWYNIGLFLEEDGTETARVYRSQINLGEVTGVDGIQAAGHKKTGETDGWVVEAFIPWDVIIQDISDISFGEINIEKEDLIAEGANFTAAILYLDRFYDQEAEMYETWGRYITVCAMCDDGTPGYLSAGDCVKAMGLTLVTGGESVVVENPFEDVPEGQWYTDAIMYCYTNGYMAGVNETTFGRKTNVTRAMFATILAALDGSDISGYTEMSFTDVPAGQWYSNAIEWAAQNGYASGIGDGQFGRKADVTRETLAQFFYTYSKMNGVDVSGAADLAVFEDLDRVHSWALDAVKWAVEEGLISGTSDTTLAPRASATRAEIAIIIKNYVENVASK